MLNSDVVNLVETFITMIIKIKLLARMMKVIFFPEKKDINFREKIKLFLM